MPKEYEKMRNFYASKYELPKAKKLAAMSYNSLRKKLRRKGKALPKLSNKPGA